MARANDQWLDVLQLFMADCLRLVSSQPFEASLTSLYFFLSEQLTDDMLAAIAMHNPTLEVITIIDCPKVTDQVCSPFFPLNENLLHRGKLSANGIKRWRWAKQCVIGRHSAALLNKVRMNQIMEARYLPELIYSISYVCFWENFLFVLFPYDFFILLNWIFFSFIGLHIFPLISYAIFY